jgi:uridine phosphorylase
VHRFAQLTKKHTVKPLFMYNSRFWQVSAGQVEFCICGPAVGAPMAVLALEKLIALGSTRIIVVGTCGALCDSFSVGDVFLPECGVSEEGTSAHYPLASGPFTSPALLDQLKAALGRRNIAAASGKIWTTDAPYRETWAKIIAYKARDVQAVDMEFTALLTVAAFRKVELAAVMVVSDIVTAEQWLPGFSTKIFKQQGKAVCEAIFENCLCGEL